MKQNIPIRPHADKNIKGAISADGQFLAERGTLRPRPSTLDPPQVESLVQSRGRPTDLKVNLLPPFRKTEP